MDDVLDRVEKKEVPPSRQMRLQVKVSREVRLWIQPLYARRAAGSKLVEVAESIGLREALRLIRYEPPVNGKEAILTVIPSPALLRKADRENVGPQLFVRAAAIKLGEMLEEAKAKARAEAKGEEGITAQGPTGGTLQDSAPTPE